MDTRSYRMGAQYYRICRTLSDKGTLIPSSEDVFKHVKDQNKDHYISLYKYNDEHKQKFDKDNTVSGITDTVTDLLLWDFDCEKDFEAVRSDTLELVKRLEHYDFDLQDIEIYYSGNKGTHVQVHLNEDIDVQTFKNATSNLASGLKTYDSTVSNSNRIIRIPFTKHQKSGLFKIRLQFDEVKDLSLSEIKEVSKVEYNPVNYNSKKYSLPKSLRVKKKEEKVKDKLTLVDGEKIDLDFSKRPPGFSCWKYALLNGYFPYGMKSYSLMILAATYKGLGYPEKVAYHNLKGAAEMQADRYDEDVFPKENIYKNIIKQVYSPTWQNGTYSEDSFPDGLKEFLTNLGVPRQNEIILDDQLIETIDEGFDEFVEYAENIDKYTMQFGIQELDRKLKIRKGHLISLLAPPGCGKTSVALKILNNMSKDGTHCYFGSYDMYKFNVYQKLIQMHERISEDKLYDLFKKDKAKAKELYLNVLKDNYENVSFCWKVGQSVQDLKDSIKKQEEKIGKPIELVVVDYLELVLTKASDPTAASAEAIQGLREVAYEGRVVLVLLQPNKLSSKPNEPLTTYNAAKGSSAIAQACTAVLTAHRPGLSSEHPEEDQFLGMNCVKNRNGPLFALDFGWDGPTQTIYTLDDEQRMQLKQIRDRIRMTNSDQQGGF